MEKKHERVMWLGSPWFESGYKHVLGVSTEIKETEPYIHVPTLLAELEGFKGTVSQFATSAECRANNAAIERVKQLVEGE